jgi:hypothetical protein
MSNLFQNKNGTTSVKVLKPLPNQIIYETDNFMRFKRPAMESLPDISGQTHRLNFEKESIS